MYNKLYSFHDLNAVPYCYGSCKYVFGNYGKLIQSACTFLNDLVFVLLSGKVDPRSIIMMVTFAVTCLICIGVMFFGWFKHLLPKLRLGLGKVSMNLVRTKVLIVAEFGKRVHFSRYRF